MEWSEVVELINCSAKLTWRCIPRERCCHKVGNCQCLLILQGHREIDAALGGTRGVEHHDLGLHSAADVYLVHSVCLIRERCVCVGYGCSHSEPPSTTAVYVDRLQVVGFVCLQCHRVHCGGHTVEVWVSTLVAACVQQNWSCIIIGTIAC